MNQVKLKLILKDLTHEERVLKIKSMAKGDGTPLIPEQDIPDFLNYLFAQRPEPVEKKQTGSDMKIKQAIERCDAMAERFAAEPRQEPKPDFTPFERDILHNRHLMKGSTDFDFASFHNPNLDQSRDVIRWIQSQFKPSHARMGLLLGDTGAGKTWGFLAFLNEIASVDINRSGKVQSSNATFITAYRISEMVSNYRKFQDDLDQLRRISILLIDELGGEPTGFRGADFLAYLDNLIAERHKFTRMRTLITSNWIASSENPDVPTIKSVYGERIISRFNHVGLFKETTEGDMRCQVNSGGITPGLPHPNANAEEPK